MPKIWTTNAQVSCPHGGGGRSIPVPPRQATIAGGEILLDGDQGVFDTPPCLNTPPCVGLRPRLDGAERDDDPGSQRDARQRLRPDVHRLPAHEDRVARRRRQDAAGDASGDRGRDPARDAGGRHADRSSVVPPTFPFSIATFGSTSQPATVPFSFSLSSQYPLKWMLWQVGPPAMQLDVTAGIPSQVTVLPVGASPDGTWSSPSATVSVTIMGTYRGDADAGQRTSSCSRPSTSAACPTFARRSWWSRHERRRPIATTSASAGSSRCASARPAASRTPATRRTSRRRSGSSSAPRRASGGRSRASAAASTGTSSRRSIRTPSATSPSRCVRRSSSGSRASTCSTSTSSSPQGQENLLLIRVEYRIRANNAVQNLVYPFYVTEGGVS